MYHSVVKLLIYTTLLILKERICKRKSMWRAAEEAQGWGLISCVLRLRHTNRTLENYHQLKPEAHQAQFRPMAGVWQFVAGQSYFVVLVVP